MITLHATEALVSSTDATGSAAIPQSDQLEYHLVLVTVSAAANVRVEGSANGTRWVPLSDFATATDSIAVKGVAPHMRVFWSDNTGTVTADLIQHEET
jgi:hypothetical protein